MRTRQRTWAIVLAAGDGTRLASLTTDARGNAVPKQYCSLNGGDSLLQEAIQRAARLAPRPRTCVIVAEQHRRYWGELLWALPGQNIIVQPANRGTAHGILLSVLSILDRDPLARIVFLPADHYVRDERALGESLRATERLLTRSFDALALVGIEPEEADPELGYIEPGGTDFDGSCAVARFIEKPDLATAQALIARGALWNSFIFGACGPTLLALMRARMGAVVDAMATALARDARVGSHSRALTELYEDLPAVDFSCAVLQGAEGSLRVVPARACGWSDLGTPRRVAETLYRLQLEHLERPVNSERQTPLAATSINLAAQHARLGLAV
jgi:mannose-1-phosphate guanylyltransferase